MVKVAHGNQVSISKGETLNHNDDPIDVEGFQGTITDEEGYEKSDTGDHMVGVKLDEQYGGGHVYVQDGRLRGHGRRSFSLSGIAQGAWDRIFGRGES